MLYHRIFMPYPEIGEELVCAYCGKKTKATKDTKEWLMLSNVEAGEEGNWEYFCSLKCLRNYLNQLEGIKTASEFEESQDATWKRIEELLRKKSRGEKLSETEEEELKSLYARYKP